MKKYELHGVIMVEVFTQVEANTLNEAVELSRKRRVENYDWADEIQSNHSWISLGFSGGNSVQIIKQK
jgi:hypothetical protein